MHPECLSGHSSWREPVDSYALHCLSISLVVLYALVCSFQSFLHFKDPNIQKSLRLKQSFQQRCSSALHLGIPQEKLSSTLRWHFLCWQVQAFPNACLKRPRYSLWGYSTLVWSWGYSAAFSTISCDELGLCRNCLGPPGVYLFVLLYSWQTSDVPLFQEVYFHLGNWYFHCHNHHHG